MKLSNAQFVCSLSVKCLKATLQQNRGKYNKVLLFYIEIKLTNKIHLTVILIFFSNTFLKLIKKT